MTVRDSLFELTRDNLEKIESLASQQDAHKSKAVEDVINAYENTPDSIEKISGDAARFIAQTYSLKVEEEGILKLRNMLIDGCK